MAAPFTLRWRLPETGTTAVAAVIGPQGRSATWIEGDLGDGATTDFTIAHGLGTFSVAAEIFENAAPRRTKIADVSRLDVDTVRIVFGTPPTLNQYHFILHGPPGPAGQ